MDYHDSRRLAAGGFLGALLLQIQPADRLPAHADGLGRGLAGRKMPPALPPGRWHGREAARRLT